MAPPVVMAIGAGVSAVGSLLGGQAAMAAGSYQQSIAERNANVYEDKADQAIKIGERNVKTFNKAFNQVLSSTESAYIGSGVRLSGTPLEILEHNLAEAEIERMNIMYDAKVQNYDFKEQAVMARMQGEIAMFQARSQRTASYLNAAGTLVNVYGTNKLISMQANNQKILTDQMVKHQNSLTNQINTLNQKLNSLNLNNTYKLEEKFGSLLR
tara:strand:- start:1050 stop:1685 length:636 start_codon:yes stop_codon:yes gene_type:complete